MDGIDGISAMEAIMIGAGIGLMHTLRPMDVLPASLAEDAGHHGGVAASPTAFTSSTASCAGNCSWATWAACRWDS